MLSKRTNLVHAEATRLTAAAELHVDDGLVERVAAVCAFACRKSLEGVVKELDLKAIRKVCDGMATRILEGEIAGNVDEQHTDQITAQAERELVQLCRHAGRLAVLNTIRRISQTALHHHILRRELQAAHKRGLSAAAGSNAAKAAARAVNATISRLDRWEAQWRAAWPPCHVSAVTTQTALVKARNANDHGAYAL